MIKIQNVLECESLLQGIDAVVFDLDDTLYPEKEYVRSGFRAITRAFPEQENMEEKLWGAFEKGLPAIDTVLEDVQDRQKALHIYRTHKPDVTLYPGVKELLHRFKGKKKLGMITDGRPEGQREKIRVLQIEDCFDKIIITDELGGPSYRKPNETAFRLMQQALAISFDRMVYIGDNIKKDFIAPEALGMKVVWIQNKDGLYTD